MNARAPIDDCLELMQRLIEYRYQKALHHRLMKAADHSMLDIDVLILIYHFAKIAKGDILEIGSFLGGSTIAAGLGARDSGSPKKIISIEPGGRLKDHRLATRDIFKDLKKNLSRAGLLEAVTLINGSSFEEKTIATVREMTGPGEIGLFIFDADANVRRDIDCYGERFAAGLLGGDRRLLQRDGQGRPDPNSKSTIWSRRGGSSRWDFTAGGPGSVAGWPVKRKFFCYINIFR